MTSLIRINPFTKESLYQTELGREDHRAHLEEIQRRNPWLMWDNRDKDRDVSLCGTHPETLIDFKLSISHAKGHNGVTRCYASVWAEGQYSALRVPLEKTTGLVADLYRFYFIDFERMAKKVLDFEAPAKNYLSAEDMESRLSTRHNELSVKRTLTYTNSGGLKAVYKLCVGHPGITEHKIWRCKEKTTKNQNSVKVVRDMQNAIGHLERDIDKELGQQQKDHDYTTAKGDLQAHAREVLTKRASIQHCSADRVTISLDLSRAQLDALAPHLTAIIG
jgi:hypothetical protein